MKRSFCQLIRIHSGPAAHVIELFCSLFKFQPKIRLEFAALIFYWTRISSKKVRWDWPKDLTQVQKLNWSFWMKIWPENLNQETKSLFFQTFVCQVFEIWIFHGVDYVTHFLRMAAHSRCKRLSYSKLYCGKINWPVTNLK